MKNLSFIYFIPLFLTPFFGNLSAQLADREVVLNFDREALNLLGLPYRIAAIVSTQADEWAPLGIGYRGLNYTPHYIRLAGGQTEALTGLLGNSIQDDQLPEAVLRVTGLTANQEVTFTAVRMKVELEAELLIPAEHGYLVYGPVRKVQMEIGGNVKRATPREITELLQDVITELVQLPGAGGVAKSISEEEITEYPASYPIQQRSSGDLPSGVYASHLDFRAGQVDTLALLETRAPKLIHTDELGNKYFQVSFSRPDGLDQRAFREVWGVQHEGYTFFRLPDGTFYQLQRTPENDFITHIPGGFMLTKYDGDVVMASAMFGLVGGLLMAAASRPDGGEITAFRYNLSTGQFIPADQVTQGAVYKPRLMITSSRFSKKKVQLLIRAADGTAAPLAPDKQMEIPASPEVCFQLGDTDLVCEPVPSFSSPSGRLLGKIVVMGRDRYRLDWLEGPDVDVLFNPSDPD
ncbi:hypothetical protein [Neolewinella antarctica]|uniref:Uncharacterized protein n=1 Tax=Neolewinella antarctica TaxID=442734 RepID=A0ABX0XEW6_9BACT|nr:hypothetical protein [Neolewinella antarctica]NJC27864.1 hypothetical protein [Neolewinella antarctica]